MKQIRRWAVKSLLYALVLVVMAGVQVSTSWATSNFYGATSRTGGGAGSLDSIDGTTLATADGAYVITSTKFQIYYLDASSGAAEADPDVIAPDANAGNKRWILIFEGDAETAEIAQLAVTDGNFIVGNGSTWVAESGATVRTSLGLGAGDSPSWAGATLGTGAAGGGLNLRDQTTWAYYLTIHSDSDTNALSANRTLTVDVQDVDRNINLGGDVHVEGESSINQDTTTDASPSWTGATIKGTTGGYIRKFAEATKVLDDDDSDAVITLNIPTGANILGVQLRVDETIVGCTTWSAAFSGGNTAAICTGGEVGQNTKINSFSGGVTTATTQITVTAVDGGADFSDGTIRAIVYYETFTVMDSL